MASINIHSSVWNDKNRIRNNCFRLIVFKNAFISLLHQAREQVERKNDGKTP
jgi:hypothetical protein